MGWFPTASLCSAGKPRREGVGILLVAAVSAASNVLGHIESWFGELGVKSRDYWDVSLQLFVPVMGIPQKDVKWTRPGCIMIWAAAQANKETARVKGVRSMPATKTGEEPPRLPATCRELLLRDETSRIGLAWPKWDIRIVDLRLLMLLLIASLQLQT